MKKFIVVDKEQGFSWISDDMEEVVTSMGYEGETWDDVKEKVEGAYEVIEIEGTWKYLLD